MNELNPLKGVCGIIGQSTCTQLSNIGSAVMRKDVLLIALSAIGIGVVTGYKIYKNWNATIIPTKDIEFLKDQQTEVENAAPEEIVSAVAPITESPKPPEPNLTRMITPPFIFNAPIIPKLNENKLPLSILEESDQSILYELPHGKPDSRQECKGGLEKRDRVVLSAQKGHTCFYYAMSRIRYRIGKNPSQDLAGQREKERACSEWRKKIAKLLADLPETITMSSVEDPMFKESYRRITHRDKFSFISRKESIKKETPQMASFLEGFFNDGRFANAYQYAMFKYFGGLDEINTTLHKQLNIEPRQFEIPVKFSFERTQTLQLISQLAIADAYGLQLSSWCPNLGIDHLIKELKEKGPLFLGGKFGDGYYLNKSKEYEKVGQRDIFAWPKGAKRTTVQMTHGIVIIGAKKVNGKELAYFIDPMDSSDPNDHSKQKIYMISFQNLISNIDNLADESKEERTHDFFAYAYYGNFELDRTSNKNPSASSQALLEEAGL